MCWYDLQKGFDSLEYPIPLERLYEVGVNCKLWRLLRDWHEGGSGRVSLDGRLLKEFTAEKGVKQRSVLSPALFLLVMDPLL